MKLGIDVFLKDHTKKYKNQRIGLITNMTGVNKNLKPTIDLLYNHPDVNLVSLFGPEHGIRGDAKAGEGVEASVDQTTQLPVYSLYGETRKPTQEMLEDIDVLIFDLQDVGSRYYTYVYTMAYVMEACREYGKELVVLDRPNPIAGVKREGNLVDTDYHSFVGMYPILNRHGLTVGELALLYKNEFNLKCDLSLVPMKEWERTMYFDETGLQWVPPSPNTTTIDMCILYAGTCLFEGTNASEGRGTTQPFEIVGAPYIDGQALANQFNERQLKGVIARPTSFIPTYQKYKDELCSGVQLHVTDRETISPLKVAVSLLNDIAQMYPEAFAFSEEDDKGVSFFDLLAGNGQLRQQISEDDIDAYFKENKTQVNDFEKMIEPYLLY